MINDHLSISRPGFDLLKSIETLRLTPYDDQTGEPVSAWCAGATIGYGHLMIQHEWPKFAAGIDKQRAERLLDHDLRPVENAIRHSVVVPLKQNEFDAVAILAFNIGIGAWRKSSALRMINDPRAVTLYPTLESAWKAWDKSHGKRNQGLVNRRACEWRIWNEGVYERW